MILTPAQNKIAEDIHRFRVINCGRRFGKTTLAVEEIKGKALAKSNRICYIAPTYQQARDIAWEMLKSEMLPIVTNINESRLEITVKNIKGTTSFISLRGWESIETLRGQSFDFIVIDEVASMRNFWSAWQEVVRPTLTDRKGEVMFISTPKGFNHFYDLYNFQEKDSDYKSFHFTTYDNPFIPKEEIDKASKEIPETRFHQEYMADFRKTEGLVYKEFDRVRDVFDELPENVQVVDVLASLDWGFTNPAASHKIYKDSQRHYWVMEEFYKTGKSTGEIIEWVKTYKANKVYPDPAEPDRLEEARKSGLNVRDVSKDIEAGIACVQDIMKQHRLHIHKSCENTIWEFETYAYPEKKPDKNEFEVPIKENDHAMDAIRYVLYMQEGKNNNGVANVRYAQSSMPIDTRPQVNDSGRKTAFVHVPRL